YFETRWVQTRDETWLRMTKFWGKLFLINFALGVVTGITLEFQFGMNWAEYSRYVGDIFGAPLAIEATVAFFMESVFIGLWIFGWNKVSPRVHALSIWLVAIATNMSALWILLANGWMQNPVGYHIVADAMGQMRAEMIDFGALLTNPTGWYKFTHTVTCGYVVAAFFVMGVSAWHLLKRSNMDLFKRSFRTAAVFGLVSALAVAYTGDLSGVDVAKIQPAKMAAMEAVWDTTTGAGLHIIQIPDEKNETNLVATLTIPKMLSFIAFRDTNAEIKGLKDFPKEERPPVWPTFWSFRIMVLLGLYMIFMAGIGVWLSRKPDLEKYNLFLKIMLFSIPVPYLAGQLGWLVAEIGRQPWIVYGVLKTADAVSPSISTGQVVGSLLGFIIFYGGLAILDIYLMVKLAKKGPDKDVNSLFNLTGRR
ncbi:MAG: cytochrome ubiquinol oxidase subunit I, partial [Syntrophobacterales bacterium]|nr:cytochrome ubiquinol oxidase subunit I [Syntrophobacterales bacterium]